MYHNYSFHFYLQMTQMCLLVEKDVRQLIAIMNNEFTKIVEWLNVNKLSLNVKKTHYIIFSSFRNCIINDTKINGQMVARVACTKFLRSFN